MDNLSVCQKELPIMAKLRFGLIINPFAGIGGKVGLKGSDGAEIRQEAFARGATQKAEQRARMALEPLAKFKGQVQWLCASGDMGENLLAELSFDYEVLYQAQQPSQDVDTLELVKVFNKKNLDLIVFVGGDGTARNICSVIEPEIAVLGIPAGVKIHSGVYALSPNAAAKVLTNILKGRAVSLLDASVMDIDENAFRAGVVKAKKYGEMLIPAEQEYMQSTKVSSSQLDRDDEGRLQADIAEFVAEQLEDDYHYLIGSGTSCAALMDALDLPNTLLGIDWVHQGQLMGQDLNETDILKLLEQQPKSVKIIITIIGGQGHIIGRGNQQISSKVLAQLDKKDLVVIATPSKINQLDSKPMIIDSDDPLINQKYSGLHRVIIGYDDEIYYQAK